MKAMVHANSPWHSWLTISATRNAPWRSPKISCAPSLPSSTTPGASPATISTPPSCHCEERSDEATSGFMRPILWSVERQPHGLRHQRRLRRPFDLDLILERHPHAALDVLHILQRLV